MRVVVYDEQMQPITVVETEESWLHYHSSIFLPLCGPVPSPKSDNPWVAVKIESVELTVFWMHMGVRGQHKFPILVAGPSVRQLIVEGKLDSVLLEGQQAPI